MTDRPAPEPLSALADGAVVLTDTACDAASPQTWSDTMHEVIESHGAASHSPAQSPRMQRVCFSRRLSMARRRIGHVFLRRQADPPHRPTPPYDKLAVSFEAMIRLPRARLTLPGCESMA
jgi:hypothetical protein